MLDFGDGHVARMARVARLADLAAVVAHLAFHLISFVFQPAFPCLQDSRRHGLTQA